MQRKHWVQKHPPALYFVMIKYKTEAFFIKHRAKFTTDLASLKSTKVYQIWAIKCVHKLLFISFWQQTLKYYENLISSLKNIQCEPITRSCTRSKGRAATLGGPHSVLDP